MPDPRPLVETKPTVSIAGTRCESCGLAMVTPRPRCSGCGGSVVEAAFGPDGVVWSSTVVRIRVGDRTPPYALAYVDVDDGPRVLAHTTADDDQPLPVGTRVRLVPSVDGDLTVEVVR